MFFSPSRTFVNICMNAGLLEYVSKILMSPRTSCRQSPTFVRVNIYEPFDVIVCVCSCGCRATPVHVWLQKSCTVLMAINSHLSYFNWQFLSKPKASPDAKCVILQDGLFFKSGYLRFFVLVVWVGGRCVAFVTEGVFGLR